MSLSQALNQFAQNLGRYPAARHASGLGPVAYDDPVDLSEYDIAYTKEDE